MKDLTSLDNAVSALFRLSRDAVLGVRSGMIVFANPAAVELFRSVPVGRSAYSLLPGYIFEQDLDCFVCSAELGGCSVSVSVSSVDGLFMITIPQEAPPAGSMNMQILNELRSSVFNLKMASDQIIARASGEADPKLITYASVLYHNYYAMLRLTSNLSAVNELTMGTMPFNPLPTDLGLLCSQLVSSVRYFIRDRGVELDYRSSNDDMVTAVDREKVEQLILNLLSNSLLHTSPGDRISMNLRREGNRLILALDDNGTGIPHEKLAYIFTLQETASPAMVYGTGAGMGLFIARGIARLHGGALLINSREKHGTSVRVMLPVENADGAAYFRDSAAEEPPSGMQGILTELSGVLDSGAYQIRYFD
jgi:hypothetical protein